MLNLSAFSLSLYMRLLSVLFSIRSPIRLLQVNCCIQAERRTRRWWRNDRGKWHGRCNSLHLVVFVFNNFKGLNIGVHLFGSKNTKSKSINNKRNQVIKTTSVMMVLLFIIYLDAVLNSCLIFSFLTSIKSADILQ